MTVHDISTARKAARDVPKRHGNWRKDWERALCPEYDSETNRWNVSARTMFAAHDPSNALFELEYDYADLLCSVEFLSGESEAPSCDWQPKSPELRELVRQIIDLYLHRW